MREQGGETILGLEVIQPQRIQENPQNHPLRQQKTAKNKLPMVIVFISLLVFILDNIYRVVKNIDYYNKEACFFYQNAPGPVFIFYENYIELWLVTVFGVFCAVLLNRYFTKLKSFYPKGPITSFLYGSLIPVCACSTIPILTTMQGKLRFRTLVTFITAAPLLSPTIIFLSFSILGVKYAILRIACAFILAVGAGYFLELFYRPEDKISLGSMFTCNKKCPTEGGGLFDQTWSITKKLFPYILIAGTLALTFSVFENNLVEHLRGAARTWYGSFLAVVIGIPLYVCNGADILLLRSFDFNNFGLPYGSAVAFSLSANAICIPSIVLLIKIMGKRLTSILTTYIAVVCLGIGLLLK